MSYRMDEATKAVIREVYPELGGEGTAAEIVNRGLQQRKPSNIRVWAHEHGIRCTPEAKSRIASKSHRRSVRQDTDDADIVTNVELAKRGLWPGARKAHARETELMWVKAGEME